VKMKLELQFHFICVVVDCVTKGISQVVLWIGGWLLGRSSIMSGCLFE